MIVQRFDPGDFAVFHLDEPRFAQGSGQYDLFPVPVPDAVEMKMCGENADDFFVVDELLDQRSGIPEQTAGVIRTSARNNVCMELNDDWQFGAFDGLLHPLLLLFAQAVCARIQNNEPDPAFFEVIVRSETIVDDTPISKSEYVQEMGRAGRNGIESSSSIVYLGKSEYKEDYKRLIDRNVKIDNILSLLNRADLEDEFKTIVGKIFGNVEDKIAFVRKVITVSDSIQKMDLQGVLAFNVKDVHNYAETSKIMRYLYVLHKTGIIYSWYFEGINEKEGIISFYIDQGKEKATLDRVKQGSLNYINSLGIYKKATHQIKEAESIEDVIMAYVEWHYSQLLYYHREQFIDMLDFLDVYKDRSDAEKAEALESYFALSILDVQRDVKKTDNLSVEEIIRPFP